jgi:hypothetical protein
MQNDCCINVFQYTLKAFFFNCYDNSNLVQPSKSSFPLAHSMLCSHTWGCKTQIEQLFIRCL